MDRDETLEAAAPPRPEQFAPGNQVGGRYKVLRFVAAGAMGEVYAAEDLIIGTTIALKVLRTELTGNPSAVARVRREIALARKVTDVHICRVHDVGEHGNRVFLTMELLDGKTLAEHVAACGALPVDEVERIARQLIAGLAALHRAGIIHRDFKTANSMLVGTGDDARVVITDFGLARDSAPRSGDVSLTADAAVIGTPAYMAPEQVRGEEATPASDIYALGVVLFELLTGERPFQGDNAMAIASARLTTDPPSPSSRRPELSPRWDAIVLRCLARDPAKRFARVEDVLGDPPARLRSRKPIWIGAGAAIVAVSIGYVATRDRGGSPTPPIDAAKPASIIRERRLTAFDGRARLTSVAMSRDGNRIAYQADGELWIRDLRSAEPTRFALPAERARTMWVFDFFPDGQRLFVRTGELGAFSFDILDLRDGSFRPWRTGIRFAHLSPTADRVAFLAADGVMVAPFDGSGEAQVAAIPELSSYQFAWSADGKWIAVILRGLPPFENHIELIAADGSSRVSIPAERLGNVGVISGIAWAGSDRIFYSRTEVPRAATSLDAPPRPSTAICSLAVADRAAPRCIWQAENTTIDWFSLAAGRLVFENNTGETNVETISTDATGAAIGTLAPIRGQEGDTGTWGFTVDGRLLMSSTRQGGLGRIVVQRPDEANGRVLPADRGDDDQTAVADGNSVVFRRDRADPSGDRCELVRDRDGRQETLRSERHQGKGALCPYLRCSLATPSRCVLVRFSANSYVFQRFDLATARELGPTRRRPTSGNVTIDLSRDGSTLVWSVEQENDFGIALLDLDSGDYRELRPKGPLRPHDISWLAAGEGWLVAGWHVERLTQVIARLRPDGTYQILISDTRPVVFHNPFSTIDGRTLAVQVDHVRSDILALEGVD